MYSKLHTSEIISPIQIYANNPLFADIDTWFIDQNPFRRPVRPQDLKQFNFNAPLTEEQALTASSLAANRLLLNIYELDLVFLPNHQNKSTAADFHLFYNPETRRDAQAVRPILEKHLFDFLEKDIEVGGSWTNDSFKAYCDAELKAEENNGAFIDKLLEADDPRAAARYFLIQLAGDYLTEASAMARNMPGNYGPAQSNLFTILIDEYGYGVHDTKHSTLYETTLESANLSSNLHTYWQFYLPSSIALINYFHYICANHEHFFKYLGALFYTESSLVFSCRRTSKMLKQVFGADFFTDYFDEHVHIDVHHGDMAFNRIILPIVEKCGEQVLPQILAGFEEFRLLQEIADRDYLEQIAWSDRLPEHVSQAAEILKRDTIVPDATFIEKKGELSNTHIHDNAELFYVIDGEIKLVATPDKNIILKAGEGIIIPKNRLHGSVVISDTCNYGVKSIGLQTNAAN